LNVSVFARLGWMGFRQDSVEYQRPDGGRDPAALPLLEKIDVLTNAVVPFSDLPLRAGMAAGILVLVVGLVCAAASFLGVEVGPLSPGWLLLLSGILIVGGLNLFFLGIIGSYLWRAIDGRSARPQHLVERRFGLVPGAHELSR
jgi:dolichol-phosphate mannosyltransferase